MKLSLLIIVLALLSACHKKNVVDVQTFIEQPSEKKQVKEFVIMKSQGNKIPPKLYTIPVPTNESLD